MYKVKTRTRTWSILERKLFFLLGFLGLVYVLINSGLDCVFISSCLLQIIYTVNRVLLRAVFTHKAYCSRGKTISPVFAEHCEFDQRDRFQKGSKCQDSEILHLHWRLCWCYWNDCDYWVTSQRWPFINREQSWVDYIQIVNRFWLQITWPICH